MATTTKLIRSEASKRVLEERHVRAPLPVPVDGLCQHFVFMRADTTSAFCDEGWRPIFSHFGLRKIETQRDAVFGSSADVLAKCESGFVASDSGLQTRQSFLQCLFVQQECEN